MKTFSSAALVAVVSMSGLASAHQPARDVEPVCQKTYTVAMVKRADRAAYSGIRRPSKRDLENLSHFERCRRNPATKQYLDWYRAHQRAMWRIRISPPMNYALASVYDAAGGPIACGGNSYAMGVANKTLPCGTRLQICYASCVNAVVFDRGPYIAGRELDLSRAVEYAIGFPYGVATVRYALLR